MVIGYVKNPFIEWMDWLYIWYSQIAQGDLMRNQDEIQVMYNIKDPIEILLDQMDTGQEFAIAGNSPFSDWQLLDMGIVKTLATQ